MVLHTAVTAHHSLSATDAVASGVDLINSCAGRLGSANSSSSDAAASALSRYLSYDLTLVIPDLLLTSKGPR